MKLIQMQYSPDAFDNFVKQKLDEIDVDPSLTKHYWHKMNADLRPKGLSNGKKLFYFSLSVIILSIVILFSVDNSTVGKNVNLSKGSGQEKIQNASPANEKALNNDDNNITNDNDKVSIKNIPVKINNERKMVNESAKDTNLIYHKYNKLSGIDNLIIPADTMNTLSDKNVFRPVLPVIPNNTSDSKSTDPLKQDKKKNPVNIIW